MSFTVTPVNFSGEITLKRLLDKETRTGEESDDPRISGDLLDGSFGCTASGIRNYKEKDISFVKQETKRTQFAVLCASYTQPDCPADTVFSNIDSAVVSEYTFKAERGKPVTIVTYIAYTTNQRNHRKDYEDLAFDEVLKASEKGFGLLMEEQSAYMERFWENADVSILGDEAMTRSMRFNR